MLTVFYSDMFRDDIMESKLEAVMALAALLQVRLTGAINALR